MGYRWKRTRYVPSRTPDPEEERKARADCLRLGPDGAKAPHRVRTRWGKQGPWHPRPRLPRRAAASTNDASRADAPRDASPWPRRFPWRARPTAAPPSPHQVGVPSQAVSYAAADAQDPTVPLRSPYTHAKHLQCVADHYLPSISFPGSDSLKSWRVCLYNHKLDRPITHSKRCL